MSPPSQSTTGSRRLLAATSALRHRNYRLYWFGQLFSVLAQNMEAVAQSWLVLEITNSPLLLGLTGLAFSVPTIALTLLGGAVADRTDRKRIEHQSTEVHRLPRPRKPTGRPRFNSALRSQPVWFWPFRGVRRSANP